MNEEIDKSVVPAPAPAHAAALKEPEDVPSLKRFLLQAVLWLPLAFFLWFVLRTAVVWPAVRVASAWLTSWMPEIYGRLPGCNPGDDLLRCAAVGQNYETFAYTVLANVAGVPGLPPSPVPVIEVMLQSNALMYCYGIAVFIGLVMATPLDWKRTFAQLGAGLLVLVPAQAFSLVGDALKSVAFDLAPAVQSGITDAGFPEAAALAGAKAQAAATVALAAHGLGAESIGLWYQFGFLFLPPIVPVVTWILLNRRFIESLGARLAPRRGTARRRRGPTAP
ncbi:MAG TPA: exosortase H-associated membrane protein [Xanthomonadales bacterium]|nr:exosortase H-associated membrane protein [Xanthomonadales bacterium]